MNEKQSEPNAATSEEETLQASLEALARRARIAPGAELGEAVRKTQQKVQRLQRLEAKASFQEKVAIGNVAEELGLTSIPLSGLQLRGAVLAIIAGAKDPAHLLAFEAAGKAWLDSRRPGRDPGTFRVFVTATTIGAELAQACGDLRLRRVPMPKGFAGRLALAQAVELGRRYSATVHLEHQGEELQLVDRGNVDAKLLGKLTAGPGIDGTSVQIAAEPKDDLVIDTDDSFAALATSEAPAMAANTNDEDAETAEADMAASSPQHEPMRALRRPMPR